MDFITLLLSKLDKTYGSSLYNKSLTLQNYLLKYLIEYHLEKDLITFEKIEAQNISSLNPLIRNFIRNCNRDNEKFKNKYLTKNFNII